MKKLKLVISICFILIQFLIAPTVFAAITNIAATISFDGTAPFDLNNLAGNDSAANNGVIRTQDTFEYFVSYEALDTNNTTIVLTAPVGVYWLNTATASSVCNGTGGGSINATGNVLTCNRKPPAVGLESFKVQAIPGNIANGTNLVTTIVAGSATASSASLIVSATPKNDLYWLFNNHTKTTIGSELGILYYANFEIGATVNANGDLKGYESLSANQTITLEVGPGSYPYNCSICTQAGGPGTPITINATINPSFTRRGGTFVTYPGYLSATAFRGLGLNTSVQIFTPFAPNYPVGQITPLLAKAINWDPNSLSGVSNYGSSYATGYDPSTVCPTSGSYIQTQRSCMRYLVDRTILTSLFGSYSGLMDGTTSNGIFGDNQYLANNVGPAAESLVVGQKFRVLSGIGNSYVAENPTLNTGSCVVWDSLLMELFDSPVFKYKRNGGSTFPTPSYSELSYPTVTSSQGIIEYTSKNFASDSLRKSYDCGKAGDGNAEWYSSLSAVPGGMTAVSGVRYKLLDPFYPNDIMGVILPLVRPATAYSIGLPTATGMPWFHQYYSDETTLQKSTFSGVGVNIFGGRGAAVKSLFRAPISLNPATIAPGTTTTLTISPLVIGPVGSGLDETVSNAKVEVTMPNSCIEPVLTSLPANAVYTPGSYGSDGVACTNDSGEAPGKITFTLGNLVAPSGAADFISGHRTSLADIQVSLIATATSYVQSVNVTAVASADTDPSPDSGFGGIPKTSTSALAVNGVAAFSTAKSVSGVTNGKVGPNEVFTYTINFGNGGSTATGVGRFVDVLPFDGDRNGTVGLGTGKIQVVGLAGAMSLVSQGTVTIQTSTDSPSSIESAIAVAGNESGQTGVNWTTYSAGAIPANITAVRFVTSSTLNPGFSGYGSIQVKAPTITKTTSVTNTVNARTDMLGTDVNTVKFLQKGSPVTISGLDGATLRGTVYYDLNANAVKDASELGIANTKVVITCTAGACLNAPQGVVFSMLTDAGGGYGFEPKVSGLIFANDTASGTALSSFQGVIAGTWTITQTPPSTLPHVNVSTSLGTINAITSGVKSGRSITGVVMVGNGIGINYNFGERLAHGKITVTKAPLTLPTGVSGPFSFTFEATCDLPVANTKYSATLANFPTTTSVDIVNIPANSTCTVAEVLPSLPAGFAWGAPVISALSPAGTMPAGGTQNITVTNQIFDGFYITKSVAQAPVQVAGELTQYDVTYQIDVINRTTSIQNYNLSDSFLFDPDLSIVGTPIVSKLGSNITQAINSSFTGSGTQTSIILEENIAAAVGTTPEIESYTVKLRFNINTFNTSNNTCNGSNANGLLNQATLSFGSNNVNAQACSNTPSGAPVFLKLKVKWVGGKATDKVTVAATTGFTSGNIALFESINSGAGNYTESSEAIVGPTQTGVLAQPVFATSDQEKNYQMSSYSCTDGVNTPIEVVANASLTIPSASAGKSLMCTITLTFIDFSTAKTAQPVTGTSVSVGDEIIYTLKTTVTGASSLKPLLITDSLDAGLTVVDKPSNCVLTGQTMVCTLAAGASVGEHSISYKTKVNENATKNKVAGVKNSITVDAGSCNPCSTEHGMWSVDTSKSSDAKGKKGIEVGQTITYTLTVKVQGGKTTQDVILKDTRSVGLAVASVPQGCQQKGLVITCVLASGSAAGEYKFVYTAEVTDDAGDFVSNKVVPNKGTCLTVCQTSIKVLREVMLRITKTTNSKVVKIGDFVRYELLVENLTGPNAKKFYIVDQAAPGLNYVEGSLKVVGDNEWKLSSNYPLKIEQLELDKGEKLVISYLMRVGAGAGRGSLKNTAWADDVRKYVSSNKATASVTRGLDPDFEATRIFGRVFEDSNENGIQDANEAGLAGVRLITTSGLIIETDSYGRYHLDDLDPGVNARGGQFIIRLDESSLPKGAYLTTENPQIKRITPALPVQFNFGVAFPQ